MKKPETLQEIVSHTLRARVVEPVKRIKDLDHVPRGARHLRVFPRYITHRYPIVGGITRTVAMVETLERKNALWDAVTAKMKATL